jgi:hypothetical protein
MPRRLRIGHARGYRVAAESGTYGQTGISVGFLGAYRIEAALGAYGVTGYPASLNAQSTSNWGGQVRTTDGSRDDVQTKISAASDGDIIEIPDGSFSWTSGVSISGKSVLIRGAGAGRVIGWHNASNITMGTGTKTFTTQAGLSISAGQTLRIWLTGGERDGNGNGTGQTPWMEGTVTSYSGTSLVMNITSTSGHSLTKRLWLITTNATTTITHNAGAGTLFSVTESTASPVGITGIRFDSGAVSGGSTHVRISGTTNGKPTLVFNNWFRCEGVIAVESLVNRGIVYDNSFVRFIWNGSNDECLKVEGAADSWTTVSTMGTADTNGTSNFYFEDNDVHGMVTAVDVDDHGRAVIRNNVLNESAAGGTHGADTSNFGVRHAEFYDNTFVFTAVGGSPDLETMNISRYLYLRGGTGTVADNTMPNITSTAWGNKPEIEFAIQQIRRNAGPNACWGASTSGTQYHCPRQIGFGYVTGAGLDGQGRSNDGFEYVGDAEPLYVWNNAPSPTISVSDYVNECGAGADVASSYIQAGRDYILTTKPDYTKFTYPHPLREG